jgi:peptidoglycan/LPS O-acetylase OafA/YrhL
MTFSAHSSVAKANTEYYPHFDILRFFLASVVMIRHDAQVGFLIPWDHAGNFAVQIFFALSGWLIGGILIETRADEIGKFYFNRVCRIWAPYFVGLLLLVLASMLRDPLNWRTVEFITYKATFTYNLFGPPQLASSVAQMPLKGTGNHFWSVDAEEQFYLIAPLILVFLPPKLGQSRRLWALIAIGALSFTVFPSIVLGVLAAIIKHKRPDLFFYNKIQNMAIAPAAMAGTALILDLPYMLAAPIFSISLVVALARRGQARPAAKYLGAISYPLYLNHWIGAFAANAIFKQFDMLNSPTRGLAYISFSVVAAAILYRLVDQPVLKRREIWWTPNRGRWAMGGSYLLIVIGLSIGLLLGRTLNFQG